ncbi:HNH endonuclease [Acinetobacter sp. HY1485]|uniref:HNH endonuclease n=1 Tax=Acinetobacter sp. HY1485 TaxID=2970918 RepID=UPI003FA463E0
MRRSLTTNTLVIICNHVKSIYEDKWIGNELHYTGMGQTGDQSLSSQNKTLAESNENGVKVHLFEVFTDTEYLYQGLIKLNGSPYQNQQLDKDQNTRKVWVFPLILLSDRSNNVVSKDTFEKIHLEKIKKAKKKSVASLLTEANLIPKEKVGYRNTQTKAYIRSAVVSELAKRLAKGVCQLCEKPAPFFDQKNQPYLETHHIEWLSQGGPDTKENTVALCPNCHKKMHIVNCSKDRKKLSQKVLTLLKDIG